MRLVLVALLLALSSWAGHSGNSFPLECEIGTKDCQQCDHDTDPTCLCSREDYLWWTQKGFFVIRTTLEDCAKEFVLDVVTKDAAKECLQKDEDMRQFSSSCNDCFADLIDCTVRSCLRSCTNLYNTETCEKCVLEYCENKFSNCSGWNTQPCNICEELEEESSTILGLEQPVFYGAVGGVAVVLISIVTFIICRCRRKEGELKEINQDDQEYQVPVEAIAISRTVASESETRAFHAPSSPKSFQGSLGESLPRGASFSTQGSFDLDDYDEKPDI